MSVTDLEEEPQKLVSILKTLLEESKTAKFDRMLRNQANYDCYNLKQDYSHKTDGQSMEFLGKQNLSVEQITSFIQQGLVDVSDWFGVEAKPGIDPVSLVLGPAEVRILTEQQLKLADFFTFVQDSVKSGLLGSLMIAKIGGRYVNKPKYTVRNSIRRGRLQKDLISKEKEVWQLNISLIRQEDYYPDPLGRNLYEIQRLEMDYHELLELASDKDSPYDLEQVKLLQGSSGLERDVKRTRETGENNILQSSRKRITIDEYWGDIVDPTTGEELYENIMMSVANEKYLIMKPTPNPLWHQQSPFVVSPVKRIPNSVWHQAVMDAPTAHNEALNELYNLMVDGGMMSVHGIKQLRLDWLEDPNSVKNGISPATTLLVTNSTPPGAQVLERVDTSSIPPDAISMFNLMNQEYHQSAYTNDLRFGVMPQRAVKATEVVEASQSITGVFNGLAKTIEQDYILKIVERAWFTIAQFMDDMDDEELKALLGKKYPNIANLSPEERFASTVSGMKFMVYGITRKLNKVKDFRKYQGLLQTIAASEVLTQAFVANNDFGKLLDEIIKSLDIDIDKIRADAPSGQAQQTPQDMMSGPGGPNMQSQIPQAAAQINNSPSEAGGIPRTEFPNSAA